ncbi:MAG: VIT family protein [Baekduia sp.]
MSRSASLTPVGEIPDPEHHLGGRSNWLRAMVLGANDGIVSTACLVLGVAAAGAELGAVVTAGIAGLVAGALSMATGEYVSVSSQRDVERADLALEARELRRNPEGELRELVSIYEQRGLPTELAQEVARTLTERDALEAHRRDELGLADHLEANPLQAAWTSAGSFSAGALLPLLTISLVPAGARIVVCVVVTLLALAALGAAGAQLGGAPRRPALLRVLIWGAIAMAVTLGVGVLVGQTGI